MPRKRKLPTGLWDRNGTYWARFRSNGRVVIEWVEKQIDDRQDTASTNTEAHSGP